MPDSPPATQSSNGVIMMESWFLLAAVVALFWGLSGIFAKYSTGRLGVARVALLITLVEGVMYSAAFLLWREDIHISLGDALLAAGSCIIGISGFLCYFESILEGQVAIAGTISAAYPALTVIGAVFLLSEDLSIMQAMGVAAIVAGVIALSYEPDDKAVNALNKRSMVFAIIAFFAWGAWSLSSKVAVDRVGPGNLFGFYVLSSLTAPLIYAWARRIRPAPMRSEDPTRIAWTFGIVALSLNVIGAFAYTYALEGGNASLVVPISSAYPIVTVILAISILKEKINWVQGAAVMTVVCGLTLIGISM